MGDRHGTRLEDSQPVDNDLRSFLARSSYKSLYVALCKSTLVLLKQTGLSLSIAHSRKDYLVPDSVAAVSKILQYMGQSVLEYSSTITI